MRFVVGLINRAGERETLYFVKSLLYYIYPRTFICRSEKDNFYVFYEMISENDIDTWLVTEMTEEERIALENGSASIQSVYSSGHDVFCVSYDYERDEASASYDPADTEALVQKLPQAPVYRESFNN